MANEPLLKLTLVDVYGNPLNEKVYIILRHQGLFEVVKVNRLVKSWFQIAGLRGSPQGRYKVEIDPPSYQYVSQFVNIASSGITNLEIKFPVELKKIASINFPTYAQLSAELRTLLENSGNVKGFEGLTGKNLYDAIGKDDIRRAGLLNIAAKTQNTVLTGGKTVFSAITELVDIRGDRFFAIVPQQLRDDTKNSMATGLFHDAPSLLHRPRDGYVHAGSYKTKDHYGNLQLTFFAGQENWVADIDIDDAAEIEHIFQVINNALPGRDTHPYNVQENLVGYQHIDPGYSFEV
ncbi:MAG: hypothetical protein ABIP78_09505 [Pyrinomonadaceae bacterium]